ncbi:MAG: hypothetical protein J6Y32_03715 [Bacteroidales bacterium]|nr:hypothetical protein [Bacteroidales bacterium]
MNKKYLYFIAAALWGIPGIIVTLKGIRSYATMPTADLWWLLLITAGVLVSFLFMFRRIVDRYSRRMAALPEKTSVLQTFPLRGWILIVCMSCLGIALRFVPGVPSSFTASFYSGLGPMLILAACRFISHGQKV